MHSKSSLRKSKNIEKTEKVSVNLNLPTGHRRINYQKWDEKERDIGLNVQLRK